MSIRDVLRHVSSVVTRYIHHSAISLDGNAHGYGYGYWLYIALRRSTRRLSVNCRYMNWCALYLENVGNYCDIKLLLPHSQCKLEWHALAMTHDHITCSGCSTNRPHSSMVDEFGFRNVEWVAWASYYYHCSSLASESICSGLRRVSCWFGWMASARCCHRANSILLPHSFRLTNFSSHISFLHPVEFFIASALRLVFTKEVTFIQMSSQYSCMISILVKRKVFFCRCSVRFNKFGLRWNFYWVYLAARNSFCVRGILLSSISVLQLSHTWIGIVYIRRISMTELDGIPLANVRWQHTLIIEREKWVER